MNGTICPRCSEDRHNRPSDTDTCAASIPGDKLPPPLNQAYKCATTRLTLSTFLLVSFHFISFKKKGKLTVNLIPTQRFLQLTGPAATPRLSATEAGRFTSRRSEPMKPSRRRERKQKGGRRLCPTKPLLKATTATNSTRIEMVRNGSNFPLCPPLNLSERTRAPPSTYTHAQAKVFIVYKYVT